MKEIIEGLVFNNGYAAWGGYHFRIDQIMLQRDRLLVSVGNDEFEVKCERIITSREEANRQLVKMVAMLQSVAGE